LGINWGVERKPTFCKKSDTLQGDHLKKKERVKRREGDTLAQQAEMKKKVQKNQKMQI